MGAGARMAQRQVKVLLNKKKVLKHAWMQASWHTKNCWNIDYYSPEFDARTAATWIFEDLKVWSIEKAFQNDLHIRNPEVSKESKVSKVQNSESKVLTMFIIFQFSTDTFSYSRRTRWYQWSWDHLENKMLSWQQVCICSYIDCALPCSDSWILGYVTV